MMSPRPNQKGEERYILRSQIEAPYNPRIGWGVGRKASPRLYQKARPVRTIIWNGAYWETSLQGTSGPALDYNEKYPRPGIISPVPWWL